LERIPRQFYTQEFKEEAVSLVENGGLTVAEVSLRLSMSQQTLRNWIKKSVEAVPYCSGSYQKLMRQFKMNPSLSRKGSCWDNAPMESFFGTLKTELVHRRKYHTRQEAMVEIREYIEVFRNRQRRHVSLSNLSPAVYRKEFVMRQGAA